jgi:hypothetical protein
LGLGWKDLRGPERAWEDLRGPGWEDLWVLGGRT